MTMALTMVVNAEDLSFKKDFNGDGKLDTCLIDDNNIIKIIDDQGNLLASFDAISNRENTELRPVYITGNNAPEIWYSTWDGQPINYLLKYENGKLRNLSLELEKSMPVISVNNAQKSLYIDAPVIGKQYIITPSNASDFERIVKGVYGVGEIGEYRIKYETSETPKSIKIIASVSFGAISENEAIEISYNYKWNDKEFVLSGMNVTSLDKKYKVTEKDIPKKDIVKVLPIHKDGITITRDNLDQLMSMKIADLKDFIKSESNYRTFVEYDMIFPNCYISAKPGAEYFDRIRFILNDNFSIFGFKYSAKETEVTGLLGKPAYRKYIPDYEGYAGTIEVYYNIQGYEIMFHFVEGHKDNELTYVRIAKTK